MMYYNVTTGSFIQRLNRFSALAEIDGIIQNVHIKTTGRCQELFLPGTPAFFEKSRPIWIEVKGVTLENNMIAMFPDAPTLRGLKHIKELTEIAKSGGTACLIFVIQMNYVQSFTPNRSAQPAFAQALEEARNSGVHLLAYNCNVTSTSITAERTVEIRL